MTLAGIKLILSSLLDEVEMLLLHSRVHVHQVLIPQVAEITESRLGEQAEPIPSDLADLQSKVW